MRHHVESAIRLIELGAERVSAIRMLSIYVRLHSVRGPMAEQLAYSVLAALGNKSAVGELAAMLGDDELSALDNESLLKVVRNRLRGRVHHDLRRWVELATGAAQMGLLEVHLRHAQRFAEELVETHTVGEACAVYSEFAAVPEALRGSLSLTLLDRIAAKELPRRDAATQPRNGVPLYPRPAVRAKRAV